MLVLPVEEYHDGLGKTSMANHCFDWKEGTVALALGYGSLDNYSYRPHVRYEDAWPQTKKLTTLRDIEPGEEITVNSNGRPKSRVEAKEGRPLLPVVFSRRSGTEPSRKPGESSQSGRRP